MTALQVGTANVKFKLGVDAAARVLHAQMADTDATVLNEWNGAEREALLAATGKLLRPVSTALRLPVRRRRTKGWVWAQASGVAVGMDASRFAVTRSVRLTLFSQRRVVAKFGGAHLAHRHGVILFGRDRTTGQKTALMGFHLPAGVEGKDGYQHNDPARIDAHKDARRKLEAKVAQLKRRGWDVYAAGDTNWSDMPLEGLTSCWGRKGPGTQGGRRTLDSVYGEDAAEEARKYPSASDHDRVVATYDV